MGGLPHLNPCASIRANSKSGSIGQVFPHPEQSCRSFVTVPIATVLRDVVLVIVLKIGEPSIDGGSHHFPCVGSLASQTLSGSGVRMHGSLTNLWPEILRTMEPSDLGALADDQGRLLVCVV